MRARRLARVARAQSTLEGLLLMSEQLNLAVLPPDASTSQRQDTHLEQDGNCNAAGRSGHALQLAQCPC